jgi:hypothetical protein
MECYARPVQHLYFRAAHGFTPMLLNYALCGEVLSSLNKSFLHFAANIMNRNRQRQKPPEAFQASGGRLISKEAALLKTRAKLSGSLSAL